MEDPITAEREEPVEEDWKTKHRQEYEPVQASLNKLTSHGEEKDDRQGSQDEGDRSGLISEQVPQK